MSHPNILAIIDFAIYDGVACAVTELLEGQTLRARLEAGPLSVRRAIETTVQIARPVVAEVAGTPARTFFDWASDHTQAFRA